MLKLRRAGIISVEQLGKADLEKLSKMTGISQQKLRKWV
ncbi:MAG: helix-hairpin-helix domain-containing protein [Promethearchaeota archaeon]